VSVSDINPVGLQETADRVAALGARVHQQVLDASNAAAFETYAAAVAANFGVVHQIYNNAGIGAGRAFLDMSCATTSSCSASTYGASSTAPRRSSRT
jgi:NAD(P)-dependent dehydrogenase (short-subunit alcohol dehydrogenase family)